MISVTRRRPLVSRQPILEAAWALFARHGYGQVSVAQVADQAGLSLDQVFSLFPRKEDLVFALYHQLALELEERLAEMPQGSVARRFGALMEAKIASLERHRATLQGLFDTMLDPEQDLGVMSVHMELIRRRVRGVFAALLLGSDQPPAVEYQAQWVRHLYRLHLGLVFLWFHNHAAYKAGRLAVMALLQTTRPVLDLKPVASLLARVDALLQDHIEPYDQHRELAEQVLLRIYRRRRLQIQDQCWQNPCAQCLALHRERVQEFIAAGQPIEMVLPAFPAKSPNLTKVLGDLPDTAEELALCSLQQLCSEIADLYAPGARLVICSDGHVFSDLVEVSDQRVSDYNAAIRQLIRDLGLDRLEFFNLADVVPEPDYPRLRRELLPEHSEPLDKLRERVKKHPVHRHLFDGLHRFLFEDALACHPERTRNQLRKQTKETTYQVIQRSNAWGRLVSLHFPRALRLSIHPQAPHSEKIGLLLSPALDSWVTPWHGVALLRGQDYLLMKRQEAEERGAELCFRDGRPVHFRE